eukprot:5022352-Alexandrium_andersonii.AAC.1
MPHARCEYHVKYKDYAAKRPSQPAATLGDGVPAPRAAGSGRAQARRGNEGEPAQLTKCRAPAPRKLQRKNITT